MAMSNAERQAAWRARRDQRLRNLEAQRADSELDALRRDNAVLRDQLARRDASFGASHAKSLAAENRRLAKQIADYKAAAGEGIAPKDVAKLSREIEMLKAALAEAAADDRVAALEKQVKGLRTQVQNERVKAHVAMVEAKANPATISKADHRKLAKVFHPDTGAHASKEAFTEAAQVFNGIRFNIR